MIEIKTVTEVLAAQRKVRDTHIEIALQDFSELPPNEQLEFIFSSLLMMSRQIDWLIERAKK